MACGVQVGLFSFYLKVPCAGHSLHNTLQQACLRHPHTPPPQSILRESQWGVPAVRTGQMVSPAKFAFSGWKAGKGARLLCKHMGLALICKPALIVSSVPTSCPRSAPNARMAISGKLSGPSSSVLTSYVSSTLCSKSQIPSGAGNCNHCIPEVHPTPFHPC